MLNQSNSDYTEEVAEKIKEAIPMLPAEETQTARSQVCLHFMLSGYKKDMCTPPPPNMHITLFARMHKFHHVIRIQTFAVRIVFFYMCYTYIFFIQNLQIFSN